MLLIDCRVCVSHITTYVNQALYVIYTSHTRACYSIVYVCVAASTKIEQINDVFSKTRIMSLPLLLTHRFKHFFTFIYIHFYLTFLFISRYPFRLLSLSYVHVFLSSFRTRMIVRFSTTQ